MNDSAAILEKVGTRKLLAQDDTRFIARSLFATLRLPNEEWFAIGLLANRLHRNGALKRIGGKNAGSRSESSFVRIESGSAGWEELKREGIPGALPRSTALFEAGAYVRSGQSLAPPLSIVFLSTESTDGLSRLRSW